MFVRYGPGLSGSSLPNRDINQCSLNLLACIIGSFAVVSGGSLEGRQRFMIFQIELMFPLQFFNSVRTCSFSAIRIFRFTSFLKKRYTFQWSLSFDRSANLCQLSRVIINCLISGEIIGCGRYLILMRSKGAWLLRVSKNKELNTSTRSSKSSKTLAIWKGTRAKSSRNASGL